MRSLPPLAALALSACATGSTFRSGVGDRLLEHPPFYASAPTVVGKSADAVKPATWARPSPSTRRPFT